MQETKEEDVHVFGDNDYQQLNLSLGDVERPEAVHSPMPMRQIAGVSIVSVSFGTSHSAWLSNDGALFTIGDNSNGQCGFPSPEALLEPKRIEGLAMSFTIVQVACGGAFTAAVTQSGQLATFGANDNGQLGHGSDAALDIRRPKVIKDAGLAEVCSVACGEQHMLILDGGARVSSCGFGRFGALGHGDTDTRGSPTPISALAAAPITAVAAGERHSVALTFGGAVMAWGAGFCGALGLQSQRSIVSPAKSAEQAPICLVPRPLPSLRKGITHIAAGGAHTIALGGDGVLFGWGKGASGGAPIDSHTPIALTLPDGAARILSISAGREHSLALLSDGRVLSWGASQSGQLGLGDSVAQATPRWVSAAPTTIRAIVAGGHSSALLSGSADVDAAGATPQLTRLDLPKVKALIETQDWDGLASLVGAVFGSAALFNASFADEAAGGLLALQLEQIYVTLLRTFEVAPAVLHALRDSMHRLMNGIEAALNDITANGVAPPPLARSNSSSSTLSSRRAYVHSIAGYLLTPLAALLHNPLLWHVSEANAAHRIATLIDTRLGDEQRRHLTEVLSHQPADIFAARVVRPVREALERNIRSERAGGGSPATVVYLTRLLGLARDANIQSRKRASQAEAAAIGLATSGMQIGGISDAEFYSPFLSEHLDLQRDCKLSVGPDCQTPSPMLMQRSAHMLPSLPIHRQI